jgi:HEAT repeat protein
MRSPLHSRGRRAVACALVGALLLTARPVAQLDHRGEGPESPYTVDDLIRQLSTPAGKVECHGSINPGGPIFVLSEPMKELAGRGRTVQPRLLEALGDPRIRNEAALILAEVGDKDALPRLIEFLPTTEALTPEQDFSAMCLLYALWQLTGMELGIHHKFSPAYTPEFRTAWRAWYETNRDYLYTPSEPHRTAYNWGRDRVLVDVEAKLAGRPTADYRREHPWIAFAEVRDWRDDPAYERRLKEFCLSLLVSHTQTAHGYGSRDAILSLAHVRDPRALATLHALCATAGDTVCGSALMWALEERGDPASIPVLEKIPRADEDPDQYGSGEQRRARALEHIRLLQKYGHELRGKSLGREQQTMFMRCLDGPKGVESLVASLAGLRDQEDDVWLAHYLRVAQYVDREPVRVCLRGITGDRGRDDRARTMAHAALARLGERDSVGHLERALAHPDPGVRLAAAEGLWRLGRRDGFRTLVDLLDLRPLETGGEGVTTGDGFIVKVTALHGTNVEVVRSACTILGEMGDPSAVGPLCRLRAVNLNGILGGGGSGTGWPGRPDAVALARLGDFSGVAVLRESIRGGDRLDVVGSWGGTGDFVGIGLKRFIPELLPVLDSHDERKRVFAAQAILLLLERGR